MQLGSPLDALAAALYHAAQVALPNKEYQNRDFEALHNLSREQQDEASATGNYPMRNIVRRPDVSECQVLAMFAETWGSTALGFGGIGGAAMTPAYTVIIEGPSADLAVYWAGRMAYTVHPAKMTEQQKFNWQTDMTSRRTAARRSAAEAYGATVEANW